jgi:hypothetical protein
MRIALVSFAMMASASSMIQGAAPDEPSSPAIVNQVDDRSMISLLKPGQAVKIERSASGGFNINVLTAKYVQSIRHGDESYVPPTIARIGRDFVAIKVVNIRGEGKNRTTQDIERIIAAHAIDEITLLQDPTPRE